MGKPTHKASTRQPFIYPLHAVTYSHRMALSGEWEGSLIPKSTSPFCNSAPPPARLPYRRVGEYLSRSRQHWAPSCTSAGTALSRCRSPSLLYTQSLSYGSGHHGAVILCSWGMLSEDCRLARWHVAALWCHVTSSSMNPGQRLLSLCLLIDGGIRQRGVRPRSDAMCFPFFPF
jgi:hypothetical protein